MKSESDHARPLHNDRSETGRSVDTPSNSVPRKRVPRKRDSVDTRAADNDSSDPDSIVADPAITRDPGFFSRDNVIINFVFPIILLLAAVGVLFAMGTVKPEKRKAADRTRAGRLKTLSPVEVETLLSLEATDTTLTLDVDGTVVPFREAQVAAEIAGRIIEKSVKCEAGQYVQTGDLLMKIDSTDYELEVERLTRMKEQEYQALKELDQEIINTRRLQKIAEQDLQIQRNELKRQKSMPAGFASKAEIDKARSAVLSASRQLLGNENQLELFKQRRIRLEASERLAATQLRGAETNLQRTEIRAPIEGVIVRELADVNSFVNRGSPLVVIDDTSKVEVTTSLRMDQLYWVLDQAQPRLDAKSRGYELPETPAIIEYEISGRDNMVYRWNGRLLSYNGIGLDSETRTVPVRVVVDAPRTTLDEDGTPALDASAPALVRGMYVQVKLLIQPRTPLVVIPAHALQPGNRVYQFIEDESVLDEPATDDTHDPELETANAINDEDPNDDLLESPADSQHEIPFDPSQWRAGRVVVRDGITPINSIHVSHAQTASSRGGVLKGKMWVCEVSNGALPAGSRIVVSPIGSVTGDSMPARAQDEQAPVEQAPVEQAPAEQTPADPITANPATQNEAIINPAILHSAARGE